MKLLKQYVSITLGCALMALAFDWFYAPNELTLGGFTGIAQVINFFVPALPVGVTVIVLNAPLFLMSLKRFGKRFLVRSFFAVAVNSIFIDLINAVCTFQPMDKLLGCIYGGVLVGVSLGWLLREEATTGGTVSSGTTSANSGQVITVTPSYVVLKPGSSKTITGSVAPSTASQSLTFKSNDTKIATVNGSGVITDDKRIVAALPTIGTVSSSVTVIVNRTASASSDGDNSGDGTPADETPTDPVVAAIENAASDTVALSQQEAPVVSSDALNALRTNNKTLVVNGDGYSLRFVGSSIKNTSAPVDTALTFTPSEHGVNFVLNNGEALPGTVEITFTGDYAAYSRIYLYNTVASKWQFLNAFKDNTLGADTAGEYLLTTENLRFAEMDWTFFIAGGFVMVGIVVAYIVVKKRYWFW